MNSKQRVADALAHKQTERVPIDFWADKLVVKKLLKELNIEDKDRLLEILKADLRYIEGTQYNGPVLESDPDGSSDDIWGVRRKTVFVDKNDIEKGSYEHVTENPLAFAETVKEIENYKFWPSADWYDYSGVEKQCDKYPEYAVVCGGDRLNRTAQLKPAMYLRGVENIMYDLALNQNIIEAIFERTVDFFLGYNKRIFEQAKGKIDIFFMGDDFGTQDGMMMSLDMWRKLIKPGFIKFIDLAHSFNIKVMHHTCGSVYELIPEFIDCGLDILQSLQPGAKNMDMVKIKSEYGKYISFQGGIDIQHTMPFGSPDDVRKEVRNRSGILGNGGGYILCTAHNMLADVPVENVLALYDEAARYKF